MKSSVILIKEKYGLAHVPSLHKAGKWAKRVSVLLQQGYSEEQAGMEAAKQVFSYEYKEVYVRSGAVVSDILAGL
ncbi:MAG: hypothetical protein R6V86_01935 [Spirochaetia bacterium]